MAEVNEERIKKIEKDIEQLQKKVDQISTDIPAALAEIEKKLVEIKVILEKDPEINKKENELIENKVIANTERIKKIEDNQSKVVWAIIGAFLGLLIEAVTFYIRTK